MYLAAQRLIKTPANIFQISKYGKNGIKINGQRHRIKVVRFSLEDMLQLNNFNWHPTLFCALRRSEDPKTTYKPSKQTINSRTLYTVVVVQWNRCNEDLGDRDPIDSMCR
jgi:hypothetical protein